MLRFIDQPDDNYSADQVAGLNLGGLYQQADKALGGWLPGGGTANPLSKPVRQATQAVQRAPKQAAKALRDLAIVPAIDKGIESGVLPAKEAMFARYLTNTDKPLTAYPKEGKRAITSALDDLAISSTSEKVDKIYGETNPTFKAFLGVAQQVHSLQSTLRDRAEAGQRPPSEKELETLRKLEKELEKLSKKAGVRNVLEAINPKPKISREERLRLIDQHGLADRSNMSVTHREAYSRHLPDDVKLTLGSFTIKDNQIRDRYKFDNLEQGRFNIDGRNVYPDAYGGGETASNLIELALRAGLINPRSGYDINIPLK